MREFWDALAPHAKGTGCYVNALTDLEDDRVRASRGPDRYARVAQVRATYRPGNVFRHCPNIRPAEQGERRRRGTGPVPAPWVLTLYRCR